MESKSPQPVHGREITSQLTFLQQSQDKYPVWVQVPKPVKPTSKPMKHVKRHTKQVSIKESSPAAAAKPRRQRMSHTPTPQVPPSPSPTPLGNITHILQQSLQKQRHLKEEEAHSLERERKDKQQKTQALVSFNRNTRLENFAKFKQEKFRPKSAWGARRPVAAIQPEFEELRRKKRKERERALSAGKRRIGMGDLKVKKPNKHKGKENLQQFHNKTKSKPSVLSFMKRQRARRKQRDKKDIISKQDAEFKRLHELKKLEIKTRPRKKNKTPYMWRDPLCPEDKEIMHIMHNAPRQLNDLPKRDGRECNILDHFQGENDSSVSNPVLDLRWESPTSTVQQVSFEENIQFLKKDRREAAAILIQKWVRKFLHRLKEEKERLERAKEKQQEVENILKSQMEWRVLQKERLAELRERDLKDMNQMAASIGSEEILSALKDIIDRRYSQLNMLFDDNIEAIREALEEPFNFEDENSLMRTLEKQNALATQLSQIQEEFKERVSDHSDSEEVFDEEFLQVPQPSQIFLSEVEAEPILPEFPISDSDDEEEEMQIELVAEFVIKLIEAELLDELIDSNPSHMAEPEAVLAYFEQIINASDVDLISKALVKPTKRNPLEMLTKLQELEVGTPHELYFAQEPVIDEEAYLKVQGEQEQMVEDPKNPHLAIRRIHSRMVFDAINESFARRRSFGVKGEPFPWIPRNGVLKNTVNIEIVVSQVKEDIIEWSFMQAGKIAGTEAIASYDDIYEDLLQHVREEKLANMLALEVIDYDERWTDYQFEEDQVKIDVSDIILEILVIETINNLNI